MSETLRLWWDGRPDRPNEIIAFVHCQYPETPS